MRFALWFIGAVLAAQSPKVLVIGDSISIGYTPPLTKLLAGKAVVTHNAGNAAHTANGVAKLEEWLGKENWAVIHFNFGLHDLRRMDDGKHQILVEQYELNLDRIATRLTKSGAKVTFATTTPVPDGKLSPPRVPGDDVKYNDAALRVMKKHGIPVVDLFGFVKPQQTRLLAKPNVHFEAAGYEALAQQVSAEIEKHLKQ